jgi:hypothetical protein
MSISDKIKGRLFVYACWIAAKAIKMRAKQMLNEGVFVDTTLPISKYCKAVYADDFGEQVWEFIEEV